MHELGFDGRVVAVTGAGQGLGRAHALELGRRGARVVVNDVGGRPDGTGADPSPAGRVVEEIISAGGQAVANADTVATADGGEAIIRTALDTWGRIDAVVANAGILRDRTLAKLATADLDAVLDVHLRGSFFVCAPAFRWMRDNGGGRFVLTTSASGLFGNFGQANYTAAKLGIVGLMRVIALEGARLGIKANAVAPMAATRLTPGVAGAGHANDPDSPTRVTPIVVALAHPSCPPTGETFLAGYGIFARAWVALGTGWAPGQDDLTVETVVDHWDEIRDASNPTELADAMAVMQWLEQRLGPDVAELWLRGLRGTRSPPA